ncbi:cysteine proteinase [Delitschia confertaspora ATCC 74209]|uniref:ubiquitinyl hydrolase 1 n=1 Tax=Delitschia confertaspora ATCC 74209 TaxID=1513339 RepID=A0A9P4JMN2_9PLEO|nr:cysteine proteinase [Delitschia confertaspora ATCC 74209]
MSGSAYIPTDEELANLQQLSREYEPEVTGPLVGERQSSTAITTEYANADPVYRVKTAALPSKYSHFRTCRGDGNCGWRAIAFTYFETLIRLGDINKFQDEKTRLQSMNNLISSIGYSEDIYEGFQEECWDLLVALANAIGNGNAAQVLLENFNDMGVSMNIITYFKLLTSAWMQTHSADYMNFLLGQTVKSYCTQTIDPVNSEIDNIGIAALSEALLKPIGFALDVLYLDRSPGEEINVIHFGATENDALSLPYPRPTLRLLYRPGHYDILYKAEDIEVQQPIPSQAPLHVALAAGYTDDFVPMDSSMSDVMTMIPGLYPTGLGQRWPSAPYDYDPIPTPQPQPQVAPVPTYAPPPTAVAPVPTSHQEYATPVPSSHVNHQHHSTHHGIQLQPPVSLSLNHPPPPLTIERGGPFRPSMYELEPGFHSGQQHTLPFQTSIFRNSHYNTAHFLNPDFQPEEWSPDAEYSTSSRSRHKSSSQ